jgi:hypothetical protein
MSLRQAWRRARLSTHERTPPDLRHAGPPCRRWRTSSLSLQKIWESRVLTNGGPFHQQLERALCEYLGVPHIALFTNGTIALVTALQALRITGEVITTPYSFVATSHSLLWNGIKPVFVDIDPATLNMDPARIEAAITPQTTGHPRRATATAARATSMPSSASPTPTTSRSSTTPRTPLA